MVRMLSLALTAAAAVTVTATASASAGHITLPIVERRSLPGSILANDGSFAQKREDTATLYNHTNVGYMIDLEIGTPAQKVRAQLDMSTAWLFVNPDCTTVYDAASAAYCKTLGTYTPADSKTAKQGASSRTLAYGDGTVSFDHYFDSLVIPGTNSTALTSVDIGVVRNSSQIAASTVGLAYGRNHTLTYAGFIDELAEQGMINSRTFSIALGTINDTETDTTGAGNNIGNGVVSFGGVDTKKFSGPLYQFASLTPGFDYNVQLDSVGFSKAGASESTTIANSSSISILYIGSSLSYLPYDVMQSLAKSVGSKVGTNGAIAVDCNAGHKGGSVDFTFGQLTINVALKDFVWQATDGTCKLGAHVRSYTLLGDTFLRSAYAVFDQDHESIYLAKAANCGTNAQALPAGVNFTLTGECPEGQSTKPSTGSSAGASRFGAVPTVAAGVLATLAGLMLL